MRRPNAATAAVVVLLWLAVLTVAFHGCGRIRCGGFLVRRTGSVAVPAARRMLLDVTSFDTAAGHSSIDHHHQHRKHHHHQHHQHHHHVHRWNRQGILPSNVGKGGEEIDPRYGVEKRLVPTGPNPLHH